MFGRREFLLSATAVPALPVLAGKDGEKFDLIVAGGGPAGLSMAVTAAREGLKTALFEMHGCLGGIWTSGLMSCLLDFDRSDLDREITARLDRLGARLPRRPADRTGHLYEPEYMKLVCDELVAEAGVEVHLHSPVVAVEKSGRGISAVITESKSGRRQFAARIFADCTGDGDLAARAGCRFETGGGEDGADQPASMVAILTISESEGLRRFVANDFSNYSPDGRQIARPKDELKAEMARCGKMPSYGAPTLFRVRPGLFALMANHEYGVAPDDEPAITRATFRARREIFELTEALKLKGGEVWKDIRIVATPEQLGIRGARRIRGLYTLTAEDVLEGRHFHDAVASCGFGMDVHAVSAKANAKSAYSNPAGDRKRSGPYEIPLRSCQSADIDNLYMAGRCLSGEFNPQASYRITGCAVGTGAGVAKAIVARLRGKCDII